MINLTGSFKIQTTDDIFRVTSDVSSVVSDAGAAKGWAKVSKLNITTFLIKITFYQDGIVWLTIGAFRKY